jgi:uncharacterized membrane protein
MVVRLLRHLAWPDIRTRSMMNTALRERLKEAVSRAEHETALEVRICVEGSLSLAEIFSGVAPRQRALDIFSSDRVWDTEHNTGMLIYLCIADHALEIIVDRGLKVPQALLDEWAESFKPKESIVTALEELLQRISIWSKASLPFVHVTRTADELKNDVEVR